MTTPLRAVSYLSPNTAVDAWDVVVLAHDERRVRRRTIPLRQGGEVLIDFPQPVTLIDGSALGLEDGRLVGVVAAAEQLYEVRGQGARHLMQLCWHIGNRHAKAEIVGDSADARVLILRDHVLRDMLIGLGATVTEISAAFSPEEGAYHGHGEHTHALLNR